MKKLIISVTDQAVIMKDLKKGNLEPIRTFFKGKFMKGKELVSGIEMVTKSEGTINLLQHIIDGTGEGKMWYNTDEESLEIYDGEKSHVVSLKK